MTPRPTSRLRSCAFAGRHAGRHRTAANNIRKRHMRASIALSQVVKETRGTRQGFGWAMDNGNLMGVSAKRHCTKFDFGRRRFADVSIDAVIGGRAYLAR